MRRPCTDTRFDVSSTTFTLISSLRVSLVVSLTLVVMLHTAPALAAPCWRPPVVGKVIDPFRAPDCPYCSGNRGIEVRLDGAVPVRSVEAGTVTFSGTVAGTVYVVVEHANGWKVTYGRLESSPVVRGQRVARGARIGTATGDFYFGLRVNGEYRDPEPLLGSIAGRPRLIPTDGTVRRAVPPPTWICVP